jgi:pyruvate, water dikinase
MNRCGWFTDILPEGRSIWGDEAVALAAASRAGVPVAPGFVVSRSFFADYFMLSAVRRGITRALKNVSPEKAQLLHGAAKDVRTLIGKVGLPIPLRTDLAAFLETLEDHVLAVKGSGLQLVLTAGPYTVHGTAETLDEADVLIRKLFALSFQDAELHERLQKGVIVPAPFPVLVQAYAASMLSGTAYQFDPEKLDETVITVNVHHHEHGAAKHGSESDVFRFDLKSGTLLSRQEATHHWVAGRAGHTNPAKKAARADEEMAGRVARLVRRAQSALSQTHSFTWALADGQLMLTGAVPFAAHVPALPVEGILARGLSGNMGANKGTTRRIQTKKDWDKLEDGEIAIVGHLAPADYTRLAGAAAFVSEAGHAVEREIAHQLGIPAVIGVADALTRFKDGQLITVDGTQGAVYAGLRTIEELPSLPRPTLPITGTKIMATVHDLLSETGDLAGFDGVGVLRSESILRLASAYPADILKKGVAEDYQEILAEGIERVARAVYPRPVSYQLHDLSYSLHTPKGRHEPNPTLGFRGAHRLLEEPETMEIELKALDSLLKKGVTNLRLVIPMVRSIPELDRILRALDIARDTYELPDHVWVRCETPALAIQAEEVCERDIAGLLIDVPALSGLITGLDGGNHQVGHYLDHGDGAVVQAVEYAVHTCRNEGVATALISEYEFPAAEAVEAAIRAGLNELSVEPSFLEPVHGLVASIEQRMLLDHSLED